MSDIATKLQDVYHNVERVFEAGRVAGKAEGEGDNYYDTFWDNYQNDGVVGTTGDIGARTDYRYAFAGLGWRDNTYNPKYRIKISGNAERMFTLSRISKKIEFADTSQCTSMDRMFYSAFTTEIGDINMSKVTSGSNSQYVFAQVNTSSSRLVNINKIIVSADTVFHNTTFQNCATLTHVIFEGVIGTSGLNLKDSVVLDKESIESIITCLSADTTGLSVTISKAAVMTAFNTDDPDTCQEWVTLRDTKTNWTISLA